MSIFSLFNSPNRYVNFQQRCQQIMLLWFVTAVLTMVLVPFLAPMMFLSFVPPMAFFAHFYFQNVRKTWLADVSFIAMLIGLLALFYQGALHLVPGLELGRLSSLQVKPSPLPPAIRGRHVLVIGDDLSAYQENRPATPYLNWDLAKYDLKNLDDYDAVINVYDHFRKDPPEYIIDHEAVTEKLFQRAPALARRYQKTATAGVYKRID